MPGVNGKLAKPLPLEPPLDAPPSRPVGRGPHRAGPPPGRWRAFLRSSVGAKVAMGVTGLVLFGFVVAHLSGNLLVFGGAEGLNAYAVWLREHYVLLWVARGALLAALAAHVALGVRLARANRAARPEGYARKHSQEATLAARSMLLTGVGVLLYTLFHLAHFTWGFVLHEQFEARDPAGRHDLYAMVVGGFRVPTITLCYLAALVVLGLHLAHGLGSLAQTLGLHRAPLNRPFRRVASAVALAIVLGYASIPVAVWLGWVGADVPR